MLIGFKLTPKSISKNTTLGSCKMRIKFNKKVNNISSLKSIKRGQAVIILTHQNFILKHKNWNLTGISLRRKKLAWEKLMFRFKIQLQKSKAPFCRSTEFRWSNTRKTKNWKQKKRKNSVENSSIKQLKVGSKQLEMTQRQFLPCHRLVLATNPRISWITHWRIKRTSLRNN